MKRHLIFCNGIGSIIELDLRVITSGDFGQLYDAFSEAAGFRRGKGAWPQAARLDPQECLDGVYWDMELAGARGASYRLHVLPDIPKPNVDACKRYIRRSFDCVDMHVNRIRKLIEFPMPELKNEVIRL